MANRTWSSRPGATKAAAARAEVLRETLGRLDPRRELSANRLAQALTLAGVPTVRGSKVWTAKGVLRLQSQLGVRPHLKIAAMKARPSDNTVVPKRSQRLKALLRLNLKPEARAMYLEELQHPGDRPDHWPDEAVRYSKRLRAFIMSDGSAVSEKGKLLRATASVMERRRRYTRLLLQKGVAGVHPIDQRSALPETAASG